MARSQLTSDHLDEVYSTCKRHDPHFCINNNLMKVVFRESGRDVRINTVRTANAYLYWTEIIDGEGVKLRSQMDLKYAKMIDNYDEFGSHFRIPKKCPFGQTEYIGPSRVITREERTAKFETAPRNGGHNKMPRAPQAEKAQKRANRFL